MKCFIGLGNPGRAYENTRHNVGFMAVDWFAREFGIAVKQNKCKAMMGEGVVQGKKVWLIKPMTYMNLSGESLRAFLDYYKSELEDVTVLYDDLDTAFGKYRLRYQGSSGGHNGIKSIIQHTGTQTFDRIRIGISRPAPGSDIADYVLSPFTKEEFKQLPDTLDRICEAMVYSLDHTFEQTMAKYNG
ncbi:aminoacyl-tRNA hydrolase [Paenibacillus sp. J2TS4]|uniref:aminoacyl-tRNA hydrolase n=1 Tax=Paenibacillus sp. J2TS4 TaxID=2807194 RepID=UPI001B0A835D|nr:aminoacyl-tRNA hydrolase [Paenibacillus sp. J2TS4]GIP36335.1 peptidyl-tRNA hydrolase [Paenibacillus sp. J2TS4]